MKTDPQIFRLVVVLWMILGTAAACVSSQEAQITWAAPTPTPTSVMAATSTAPAPGATAAQGGCAAVVSTSRPVLEYGTGAKCWLKLADGAAAEVVFNQEAQMTYQTSASGGDIYYFVARIGDRVTDVIGATIRPYEFVISGYGSYEILKNFQIKYHSPGGGVVACLRDANNNYQALNSVCK